MSLLELTVTAAMSAMLVTSVSVLLRSSQNTWQAYDSDHSRLEAAQATLRHVTRQLRQAEQILAISGPGDQFGAISARMADGSTYVWARNGNQVDFGVGAASGLLADQITGLSFVGYQADGTTTTTVPAEIQSVKCKVKVDLPLDVGGTRTVSGWIWLRAW